MLFGWVDWMSAGDSHHRLHQPFIAKTLDAFRKQARRNVLAALIMLCAVFFSAVIISEVVLRTQGFLPLISRSR